MTDRKLLIFAYDASTFEDSHRAMLEEIAPYIDIVKVGLEAMTAEVPGSHRTVASLVREFTTDVLDKDVMWDGKFLDVKNTMDKASQNIVQYGCRFFTIHAQASDEALRSVAKTTKDSNSLPLGVTVLTDLDDAQCMSRYESFADDMVLRWVDVAKEQGIKGFICAAFEARLIRQHTAGGKDLTLITPGIRPAWAIAPHEQRRVTTPAQAINHGADGIVVGRPISGPPAGISYAEAARRVRQELDGETKPGRVVDKYA